MNLPALPAVAAPCAPGKPPKSADEPGASGFAKLLVHAREGQGVDPRAPEDGPQAPGQRMANPARREGESEPPDAAHASGCDAAADVAADPPADDAPADGHPRLRGRSQAAHARKETANLRANLHVPAIVEGKGIESAVPVDPVAADAPAERMPADSATPLPPSICALPLPLPVLPEPASALPTDGADVDDAATPARRGIARPALATPDDPAQRTDAPEANERTAAAALLPFAQDAAPARQAFTAIAQATPRAARELEPGLVVAAPAAVAQGFASTVARPDAAATVHVAAHIETPAFAPALATQLRWLAQERVQQAQITLNPAGMGPLSVQIVIDGANARVDFNADQAATRQAIEASLPMLAAALDEGGLKLSGGGVHDGAAQRHPAWGAPAAMQRASTNPAETEHGARGFGATARVAAARGLVDLVA